ncbi:hypothetical protein CK247_30860, partial [Klebsiella pneumoniae]
GTPKGLSDVVPGDEVIVEVEGVGRLVNHIYDPATGRHDRQPGTPKGLSDVVPGDEVIVEVEGVGRLVNHIYDPA